MGKISTFTFISLDGYYAGPKGEIDWFKNIAPDPEYNQFTHDQSGSGGALLFGETTYQMMKSTWSTPAGIKMDPHMAQIMINSPKIVISPNLTGVEDEPNWKNVKILHEINPEEIDELRKKENIVILGSGSIIQHFTNLGLIDEYQFTVVPVILGNGKALFKDVRKTDLQLIEAKSFKNGLLFLRYQPISSQPLSG